MPWKMRSHPSLSPAPLQESLSESHLLEQQVNYSFFRHPAELPAFSDSIHYAKGTRTYLINGFVAGKPQTGYNGIGRKVMIWLGFNGFIL